MVIHNMVVGGSNKMTMKTKIYTANATWTCPEGVTIINCRLFGGGGGGHSGGGGGGHM